MTKQMRVSVLIIMPVQCGSAIAACRLSDRSPKIHGDQPLKPLNFSKLRQSSPQPRIFLP
ncbi:MAG: hypothetical protein KME11_22345 [Timaviella obliquedivisa GSE-PSE-MK23-08B]|nr:hypothetical protein [Timaviella obliquedivisa GSE-PSE-MK23-08B]